MRKLAFSNRAEFKNWRSYNCDKCKKAWTPKSKDFIGDCPIESCSIQVNVLQKSKSKSPTLEHRNVVRYSKHRTMNKASYGRI